MLSKALEKTDNHNLEYTVNSYHEEIRELVVTYILSDINTLMSQLISAVLLVYTLVEKFFHNQQHR